MSGNARQRRKCRRALTGCSWHIPVSLCDHAVRFRVPSYDPMIDFRPRAEIEADRRAYEAWMHQRARRGGWLRLLLRSPAAFGVSAPEHREYTDTPKQ